MPLLTPDQLKIVMRHYAAMFSNPPDDTWQTVDPTKSLKTYLPSGGVGTATPQRLYKGAVRYVLNQRGHHLKNWPDGWVDLSIGDLAPKII